MASRKKTAKKGSRAARPSSSTRAIRKAPGGTRAHDDTRLALIRAAEKLMAERSIDAVSLREVSVAAGQLNNSAVAYHFGTRDGLVDAILARHSLPIHMRWDAQIDLLERQGNVGLRPFAEMLVVEIVNKLDDPDGGWEYISIAGQLSVTPRNPLVQREVSQTPQVLRLISAMLPYYQLPAALMPVRFERLASNIYASTIGWHRLAVQGAAPVSRAVFVSDLTDAIMGLVTSPPSSETLAALAASTT